MASSQWPTVCKTVHILREGEGRVKGGMVRGGMVRGGMVRGR